MKLLDTMAVVSLAPVMEILPTAFVIKNASHWVTVVWTYTKLDAIKVRTFPTTASLCTA